MMQIKNWHSLLEYSINFSQEVLLAFQNEKGFTNTRDIVLASIFRTIIELSEGVMASVERGLKTPAELNYRTFLEAHLALIYILSEPQHAEARARAYKVGYHLANIRAAEQAIEDADVIGTDVAKMQQAIAFHTNSIQDLELKSTFDEFKALKNKFYPKWYSLHGGPTSVERLIKHLGEIGVVELPDLMLKIYSALSKSTHVTVALRAYNNGELLPIKEKVDPDIDTHNINVICSYLVSSTIRFTSNIYPEYEQRLRSYIEVYKDTKERWMQNNS